MESPEVVWNLFIFRVDWFDIETGYQWGEIEECVNWMTVHACVLDCQDRVELKSFTKTTADDFHNIQTHTVSLDLLVRTCNQT